MIKDVKWGQVSMGKALTAQVWGPELGLPDAHQMDTMTCIPNGSAVQLR